MTIEPLPPRDYAAERYVGYLIECIKSAREIKNDINKLLARDGKPTIKRLESIVVRCEVDVAVVLILEYQIIRHMVPCDLVEIQITG